MIWLILIIVFLFVYLVFREIIHQRERRELYDRIMAGTLQDYKSATDTTGPPKPIKNIIKARMDKESMR